MNNVNKCIVAKDSNLLQIPYQDYVALMDKANQGQRIRQVKSSVIADLQGFLGGTCQVAEIADKVEQAIVPPANPPAEPSNDVPADPAPITPAAKAPAKTGRALADGVSVPPIKNDVSIHFNKQDESGRLFSVFKQYYACLNDACGGTVRVTMKDGFCSLWNYDEWEEFAFVDIFEGQLRIALNPRYTDALQSLNLCEVPRLLSSRMNLVCVQVDGLNNTMLEVLVKAFEEVGLTAS